MRFIRRTGLGAVAFGVALLASSLGAAPNPALRRPMQPYDCMQSGTNTFVGLGYQNTADGAGSSVVAGADNTACEQDDSVVNGYDNAVSSEYGTAAYSGIVAGYQNSVSSFAGFIGGGYENEVFTNAPGQTSYSSVLGGYDNSVFLLGDPGSDDVIAGGSGNISSGQYGFVGAGEKGNVYGADSVIGGGYANNVKGRYATAPGGSTNSIYGDMAFGAGYKAHAINNGTFVWSDYSCCSILSTTASDQFLARASGGFTFYSNAKQTCGVTLAPGAATWSALSGCSAAKASPAADAEQAELGELRVELAGVRATSDALQAKMRALLAARHGRVNPHPGLPKAAV